MRAFMAFVDADECLTRMPLLKAHRKVLAASDFLTVEV
jgi:hypothetical protein